MVAGEVGGVALGGAHHHAGAHRSPGCVQSAAGDGGDRRRLIQSSALAEHRLDQAAHQPGGVDSRTVRGEQGAAGARDPDPGIGRIGIEPAEIGLPDAVRPRLVELGAQPHLLRGVEGEGGGAGAQVGGIDSLGAGDPAHLDHGVVERPLHRRGLTLADQ